VTNDGATILSLLDIEHPAGKILVDLAQQQDKEVRTSATHIYQIHMLIRSIPNRSEMVLRRLF
jgi:Chaperonin GroEL (HSP60 family)